MLPLLAHLTQVKDGNAKQLYPTACVENAATACASHTSQGRQRETAISHSMCGACCHCLRISHKSRTATRNSYIPQHVWSMLPLLAHLTQVKDGNAKQLYPTACVEHA